MTKKSLSFARAAVVIACAASTPVLFASGPAAAPAEPNAVSAPDAAAAPGTFDLSTAIVPASDFRYRSLGVSSSAATDSLFDERESLSAGAGAMQPPTRRRSYGRSRYQDRLHNADGSNKIALVVGAGLNLPVGNVRTYNTASYTFTGGAGYNFNKTFGVLGEFHYDHFGLTSDAINYQFNVFSNALSSSGQDPTQLAGLDANAHVIALTVNPIVNLPATGKIGGYVTGGVGFYHKTTNFTLPQAVQDYFGNVYYQNINFQSYSANAFGFNGGVGVTYKLSEFSSERLFAEARYDWLKINSNNNIDLYPFNRVNTSYVPITVGLRF